MKPASSASSVPEIGKYHLVAELARGGMGNVYLAALQGPGGFQKLIAIKELKPELGDDDTYVTMFLEEARLAARLHHPNIVQTNEVGSEDGRHYMVMEYLDGRSLHRIARSFAEREGLPLGAHLRILVEALRGLDYAHDLTGFDGERLGIVHRDVSPLNVIVTFDGQTKLLDFGIAKCGDNSLETKAGILKGRIAYMAPEQACGEPVDRRADIYSIGVMIWEAITRRRLWLGLTEVEILARLLAGAPPSLRSVCREVPADLEAICLRAMSRKPEDRYATAAALIDDMERHLARRDDVMTMREVGALLDRAFREERRQTNVLIEDTLLRVRVGTRSGVMPAMKRNDRGHADESADGLYGSELPPASTRRPSKRTTAPRLPPWHETTQRPTTVAPNRTMRTPRRHPLLWAACALVALAGIAGVSWYGRTPALKETEAADAPPPIASTTIAEPATIHFAVAVSPPSARISIDGVLATSNPVESELPKDGRMHHVLAFADGYETRSRDVASARDVSIAFDLERRTRPATPAAVVSATPAHARPQTPNETPSAGAGDAPPPEADVNPGTPRLPSRPIVTSNPYAAPE